MRKNYIWVIEWKINVWEPRYPCRPGWTKNEAKEWLAACKAANPHGNYRLAKYVREEPQDD